MQLGEIISAISNVGYPILMSIILLYYLRESDEKHDKEVSSLTDALNNIALLVQQLVDKSK